MKVQIQGQAVRLRIDEAELVRLQGGGRVENCTLLPGGLACTQGVELVEGACPEFSGTAQDWCLRLPRSVLVDYVGRLPCKDGLAFGLPTAGSGAVEFAFEVDVRDSARVRGKARR